MTDKKKYPYGVPKRDGSGRGVRANIGRGGCLDRVSGFGRGYFRKWREAISKKD